MECEHKTVPLGVPQGNDITRALLTRQQNHNQIAVKTQPIVYMHDLRIGQRKATN